MTSELHGVLRAIQILIVLIASTGSGHSAPHETNCFIQPSKCGYPDATSTGVPSGTKLARSGSITVRRDGATLRHLDVRGTVTIGAKNVTIEGSRITATSTGSGSFAVILTKGADDFTIRDSEVRGPSAAGNGLQSAVWNHYDNPGAVAIRDHFHRCADCWEGSGSFRDSYIVVNASYPGSHDEDIYVCGGSVKVDHSTLVNMHQQTATVFGDTAGCGGNRFVVTDSLLAGGGYVLYPQANSDSPTGTMQVVGNRFARCVTGSRFNAGSGGAECSGGGDAHGLFPHGGYYGVAAYAYGGPGNTWKMNVWDDNERPTCPSGSC